MTDYHFRRNNFCVHILEAVVSDGSESPEPKATRIRLERPKDQANLLTSPYARYLERHHVLEIGREESSAHEHTQEPLSRSLSLP